ncbi:MAG: beta-propeller domain-containing protein [Candidatus Thermoplasmatota archaeon]|nr:beta-propeller domain-containing protein [Candidatus Thermoplasmatota archaeon]
MRTSTWNIAVVGAVVAISALVAVWIAMMGGYIVDLPIDSEWFETDTGDPQQDPPDTPPTDVQDKGGEQVLVPEPIETVDPDKPVPGSNDQPLDIEELKRLAELEGKQDFSDAYYSPYDYYRYNYLKTAYMDMEMDDAVMGSEVPREVRDIEEADLVKVVGDYIYILNPYRGLMVFDVSDPDNPVGLGSAGILGNPVEMYVVDDRAYVIVTTSYGYWYRFWPWSPFMDMEFYPRYQIGTQLVILDISDRTQPTIMKEVGIEGFVTDSRRVGKVIYVVSSCRSWYNTYSDTQMEDSTYVMSLNIRNPEAIKIIDEVSFPGQSNEIHVTVDNLYVAQWSYDWGSRSRYGQTNLTIVDISDPDGAIIVKDTFYVEGHVNDRYQMDEWSLTFRVVSHFNIGIGQSELFTFDVSNPWDVKPLGHLVVDDEGQLMATRFAGDRGYTIHLPRSIDPLDVLDLSDPSNPVLCDVFEMPGWVTHMEIRGYKIIAIGVDDSDGERNVAVSLFDVSDPWKVVMEERVRLGGQYAYSDANWDPKALTVLDDQGLVLIPFTSYGEDDDGQWYSYSAVQVVGFDLKAGDLELGGYFEQPDPVTRTRSVNGRVLATSNRFLQVADVRDIHKPKVMETVDLCPDVMDHRVIDGHIVELVREAATGNILLRTFAKGLDDMSKPIVDQYLSTPIVKWFWEGQILYVFSIEVIDDIAWQAVVSNVDLDDPTKPLVTEFRFYITEPEGDYSYFEYPGTSWMYTYNWDWGFGFDQEDCPSNPVMVDSTSMAYYIFGTLYLIDVGGTHMGVVTSLEVETATFLGLLVRGDRILLIEYEDTRRSQEDEYYYYRYWNLYAYTVHTIDIRYDGAMTDSGTFSVPGIPVGASSDGTHVYTISQWWTNGDELSNKTLNVVSLDGDEATTMVVLDLTGKGVTVIGDTAVVIETVTKVLDIDEWGNNITANYTVIRTLSLPDMSELRRDVLVGRFTPMGTGEDFIILRGSSQSGVTIMDLRSDAEETTFAYYKVRDHLVTAHRQGDIVFLVQGSYGVTGLQLPS